MKAFTIKDLSGNNPSEIEIDTRADAIEIVNTLRLADTMGCLWVIQQNV